MGRRKEDGTEKEIRGEEDGKERRNIGGGLGRREDRSEDRFGKEREEEKSIV